ncbi:OmpW/AlkL family protein [Gluconobacter morbifer]|uniref:Outer membrane channel lipoprotein n=1 Tax=Gluconobacter morbifer G707 TaxID=1088869 RepID=G6XJI1_9PROT|nr:OmpW family outer membrane protein [Gluconobacter morbifer]EHH68086.1 outer membrane channel lipoprotein [Gluconobacter morbifer G707]
MKISAYALAAAVGLMATPAFSQTTAPAPAVTPVAPQATVSAPMTAAPVPMVNIQAPQRNSSGRCGIFETCANTKIGLGKGDFLIRLSALGVLPEDRDSSLWLNGHHIGGRVKTTRQVMPELTFEYFFTDNISADLIAASTRHEIAAEGIPSVGKVDVGSAWVLPPTITLAWHFRPHKRFNPYVGVGGTLAWFHNVSPAGGPLAQKVNLGVTGGPSFNVGFDYQVVGNWFFNFDVKQVFMRVHAWTNDRGVPGENSVTAHDSLDPTLVAAGIAYRF